VAARPGRIAAAVLLPPLGTYLSEGAGRPFLLTCLLTLFGYLPGAGFALWRVLRRSDGTGRAAGTVVA
jgi:uncharacterized membrane protein YqaE (UPF0057 family)